MFKNFLREDYVYRLIKNGKQSRESNQQMDLVNVNIDNRRVKPSESTTTIDSDFT